MNCSNCGGSYGSFLVLPDGRALHEFIGECGSLKGYNRHGAGCRCCYPGACRMDADQRPWYARR